MNRNRATGNGLMMALINTPLQRGDTALRGTWNRFSGFVRWAETAEAVQESSGRLRTPLKRGVNENRVAAGGSIRDGGGLC